MRQKSNEFEMEGCDVLTAKQVVDRKYVCQSGETRDERESACAIQRLACCATVWHQSLLHLFAASFPDKETDIIRAEPVLALVQSCV